MRPRVNPQVRDLVAQALDAGFTLRRLGSGHLALERGSCRVVLSNTRQSYRDVLNTRAEIRRAQKPRQVDSGCT